ncbi:Secretoglobin family 2A member 2, partial [Heterocephalus glaber]
MKLALLLMLATLPFCCYAGAGCQLLEDAVEKTISPNVTVAEYTEFLQPFISIKSTKEAVKKFKECFLMQSDETLANVQLLM